MLLTVKEDVYDKVKLGKRLMKRARENYYNLTKRNKAGVWEKFFGGRDFLYLRNDREFTEEFLQFITENNNFKDKLWQECINRNLLAWERYWPDPGMEEKFGRVNKAHGSEKIKSDKGFKGFIKNGTRGAKMKPGYIIAFVLILAGFIALLVNFGDSEAFIMIMAIAIFPVFIFEEYIPEAAFIFVVLAWIAVVVTIFILCIWGILYMIQNGFNKETRKSFFYTVRIFLLIMLAGIVDAVILSLTGYSLIQLLFRWI